MHLAYLDPHAVPDESPESLQILYTVDALGAIGVRVTLVTPRPRAALAARAILGRELSPNVTLHHLPDPRRRWWFPSASNRPFYFMAARALDRLGADVVLVRNLKMAEHLVRRPPAPPLVFETHEVFAQSFREEHPQPNARQRRKLATLTQREGEVYRRATGLLALTPLLLDDIRREYGIDTPGEIAPDGVDLQQALAPAVVTPNPQPLLLYLGSLHPWKGVDTLILAMQHLQRAARLVIVGGNTARITALRALAERAGVASCVEFAGAVAPGRRFEWIHRADVCLLPLTATSIASRYTSPLKLFEYLAAGKPVVVSDLESMRAVLTPEQHALFARVGDAADIARQVERLLADVALRTRLGTEARALASAFSWEARARRIARFIRGLPNRRTG
jgi:glycosyltransferase involved in cell wall biosynthesis